MKGIIDDVRHAFRVYSRTPVASGLAVVALAVAMAFVSACLSLYIDIVFKPNPGFEQSNRLVSIGQNDGVRISGMSQVLLERINEEVGSLEAVTGFQMSNLPVGLEPEERTVEFVSDHFFDGLRPRMTAGRGFETTDHDPDAEPVAVVSYLYALERFGSPDAAIGENVEITGRPQFNFPGENGEPPPPPEDKTTAFRVVGVMDRALPSLQAENTAAWLPAEVAIPLYFGPWEQVRNFGILRALGRMADGASPESVAAELNARFEDVQGMNINPGEPFDAMVGLVLDINSQRDAARQLRLFLIGSVLLALVAAANVSLFLLSRAPGRRRELGIRMAVGAPLKRLGRQLATEAGLIVLLATGVGLVAAIWLQNLLRGLAFLEGANWQNASLFDWRVLGALVVVLVILTLLVSLAPVAGLKRIGIAASARQVSSRANLTQRVACTAQISIAGVVAAAALAFGWHLALLLTEDHGYDIENVHALILTSPNMFITSSDDLSNEIEAGFVERARRRDAISSLPGIDGVAFGSSAPGLDDLVLSARLEDPDLPNGAAQFGVGTADPRYFELLDLELLSGRLYDEGEVDVMILNETAARDIFGRPDVVGETLPLSVSDAESSEVVGVVADFSFTHPSIPAPPRAFLPLLPFPGAERILIESELATADLRASLETLVGEGGIEGEIQDVRSLKASMSDILAPDRARSLLTIGTAMLVLVLSGLGYYGTQRFLVAAGRREYAIRASLGAGPRALGRLVVFRGLGLGLPGVLLGAVLGFLVAAWLRDDFVSREISALIATSLVIIAVVGLLLAASIGPARHARRTQPAPLLRED